MKRLIPIIISLAALSAGAQTPDYAQMMIRSHGKDWSGNNGWDYVNGLVTNSILAYCARHPGERYTQQAYGLCRTFANRAVNADGSFVNFRTGSLDNIAAGKVLLGLYTAEEAAVPGSGARYKRAADYLYNYLRYDYPRITLPEARGCFIHKDRYPYQMWLDGLYMGAAFYAQYQAMFDPGDNEAWSDISNQFLTIHNYTYDTDAQLNYHAWSAKPDDPSSFWARRTHPHLGCSSEFWGRGMGWYFAALVDVIEVMPPSHPDFPWMLEVYQEVAEGLARRQDQASGVWYQLLRYDNSYVSAGGRSNYLEASASCMFTYGFLKGLRLGLLDEDVYGGLAEKAYDGLIGTFITERADGTLDIHNICRSAGLGPASDPSRDGTADYYLDGHDVTVVSNEGKGIGSFIFASVEHAMRASEGIPGVEADCGSGTVLYNLSGIPADPSRALPGLYILKSGDGCRKIVVR